MGLRHSWALAGIRMPRLRSRTRCRGQPELCPGMDAEPAPEPTNGVSQTNDFSARRGFLNTVFWEYTPAVSRTTNRS